MLTVFGLGALELWAAVPAGFAFKLNPFIVFILSSSGAVAIVAVIEIAGFRLRHIFFKESNESPKTGRKKKLYEIWDKYGIAGLGLLAPWITGAALGAAIGISLGAHPFKLFIWMVAGIIICGAALTVVAVLGIEGYKTLLR